MKFTTTLRLTAGSERSGAVAAAEAWLENHFERTRAPTKYISAFKPGGGREIALERERRYIQVWVGEVPDGTAGLHVLNRGNPGQPYGAAQSRNSNLRSLAPTLATGRRAYYVKVDDLGALKALTMQAC